MRAWNEVPGNVAPRRKLNPRVAAKDKLLRIMLILRNAEWSARYREARKNLKAKLPYMFPFGTYWLVRTANVAVSPLLEIS